MSIGEAEVNDRCVSLRDAARILGVCVRREIDRGKLFGIRVGRNLRIKASELRRYMESEAVNV
jgi:excisionase family DNA binding protein